MRKISREKALQSEIEMLDQNLQALYISLGKALYEAAHPHILHINSVTDRIIHLEKRRRRYSHRREP